MGLLISVYPKVKIFHRYIQKLTSSRQCFIENTFPGILHCINNKKKNAPYLYNFKFTYFSTDQMTPSSDKYEQLSSLKKSHVYCAFATPSHKYSLPSIFYWLWDVSLPHCANHCTHPWDTSRLFISSYNKHICVFASFFSCNNCHLETYWFLNLIHSRAAWWHPYWLLCSSAGPSESPSGLLVLSIPYVLCSRNTPSLSLFMSLRCTGCGWNTVTWFQNQMVPEPLCPKKSEL